MLIISVNSEQSCGGADGGICFVETKNLDGETNLKHKQAPKELHAHFKSLAIITADFNSG